MSELPKGWVETSIENIGEISSGFGFPERFQGRPTGELPFAKVRDISKAHQNNRGRLDRAANYISREELFALKAKTVPAASVAFAKIGEALKLNRRVLLDVEAVLDNNCMAVTPNLSVTVPEFLYHFMTTVDFSPFAVATTVPSIRKDDVGSVRIPLPPVAEQKRIVAKVESLTAKSTRARVELSRIADLVDRYRQAVLISAFQGKLTASWREAHADLENTSVLIERTPAPTQPRGGREATDTIIPGIGGLSVNDPGTEPPRLWQWVSLHRLARQETGHTPSRSHPEWWDGDIPWIGIKDAGAHHGKTIYNTLQNTNEAGLANSAARLLPKGTVCLSRTASVGYVVIMGREMATSQDFATWTCTEALVPKFLMYALMAEGENIRKFGKGTTHTTIYFPEIRALHICLAPLEEQHEIVRCIDAAFAKIDRLAAEAERALELTDRLDQKILAKAFRGELVPQDPNDEPASVLLERIRAELAAAPKAKRARGRSRVHG